MRQILLFCLLITAFASQAQKASLRGKVVDRSSSEPIAWVLVYSDDSSSVGETGLEGHFRLNKLSKDTIILHVRAFPDYKDTMLVINISQFKKKSLVIKITPEDIRNIPGDDSENCPVCFSNAYAIPIVYGEQTFEMIEKQQKKLLIFAGCCHYPSYPLWYCKKCKVKY